MASDSKIDASKSKYLDADSRRCEGKSYGSSWLRFGKANGEYKKIVKYSLDNFIYS